MHPPRRACSPRGSTWDPRCSPIRRPTSSSGSQAERDGVLDPTRPAARDRAVFPAAVHRRPPRRTGLPNQHSRARQHGHGRSARRFVAQAWRRSSTSPTCARARRERRVHRAPAVRVVAGRGRSGSGHARSLLQREDEPDGRRERRGAADQRRHGGVHRLRADQPAHDPLQDRRQSVRTDAAAAAAVRPAARSSRRSRRTRSGRGITSAMRRTAVAPRRRNANATSARWTSPASRQPTTRSCSACNQIRTRINFQDTNASGFYIAPIPGNGTNHPFKFDGSAGQLRHLQSRPWISGPSRENGRSLKEPHDEEI